MSNNNPMRQQQPVKKIQPQFLNAPDGLDEDEETIVSEEQQVAERGLAAARRHLQAKTSDPNSVVVTDRTGRTIGLRRLTALDRMRLFELIGADLSANLQYLTYALTAACVTSIDGVQELWPTNRRVLERRVDILADEGIDAVARGYSENFRTGESGDLDDIKN
jgi:hypothetical protein